ncbi:MAG: hypothetical protein H8D78_21290 [Chloroflexi bacterium]|nr:hypothetical protein [Chloroflexota bacterium]
MSSHRTPCPRLLLRLLLLAALAVCGLVTVSPLQADGPGNGQFAVSVFAAGPWQPAGTLAYGKDLAEHSLDLSDLLLSGPLGVRLQHSGDTAAHLDAISLAGRAPRTVLGAGEGPRLARRKLAASDYDLLDARGRSLLLVFDAADGAPTLSLLAVTKTANLSQVDYSGTTTAGPVTPPQMPNLVVTSITPDVSCTSDGNFSGSISVRVTNDGDGATSGTFTVQVTDGKGWTGTATYGLAIASGGFADVTINTGSWVPDCQPCAAPYSFNATVDLNNDICESNETDNTTGSPTAYTVPIPDLVVTDIDFTNVSCTNDACSGNVSVIVSNNGCAAANNFQVSLTTDGCLTFTPQTVTSLAASSSTVIQFNISGSWADCTAQNCQFTAAVDPTNVVCECDGSNNDRVETYATTLPDLVVTDIDFSNVSCSNDNCSGQVEVTVQNQGYGTAANFQVSLNTDGCLSFTNNQTVSAALGNGQSSTVAFDITGSWLNCSDCGCDFTATVDATNSVCECDGSNNTRTETYTQNMPDLRVNGVTPSVTCSGDGNLQGTVTVNVSNGGCANANNVAVRLTSTCGVTFSDQTVNLTAGSNTNTDLTFNYTPGCANCTCTFTASIDPDDAICECDGTNNTLFSAPYTLNLPDVEVQSDTLAATCAGDGQCRISGNVTLVNNGCGSNLTADVPMRFTLYDNTGCAGSQVGQWTETLSSVNIASGGDTQAFTITPHTIDTNLCTNSTNCQVSIGLEADYNGSICECDGTDNTTCADNKAVDIPDLAVTNDTLSVTYLDDSRIRVAGNVTLRNDGCGSNLTTDIPVRFTLYDSTGAAGNQVGQWTETLSSVNIPSGGGSQVFTITDQEFAADPCGDSSNCQLSIRVEADYSGTICECAGAGPYVADDIAVDLPDLQVQSEALAVGCWDDGGYSISGRVTLVNNGSGSNLTSDVPVRFTLYDGAGCGGNQLTQWTETFTSVNLAAGGGTQSFNLTAHSATGNLCTASTNCQLSLLVEADYSDAVGEGDGTNNTLCSTESLSIPNLVVNSISDRVTCSGDGSFGGITVNVGNDGCGAANGAVVRLTSDCGLTFADQTVNLGAGEDKDVTFALTSGLTSCTCNFTATMDPDDTICECDGTDNSANSGGSLLIPDYEVQGDTLQVRCSTSGLATVSGDVTLVNNGCGPAATDDVPMRLTLYDDAGCSGGAQIHQWTQTLTGASMASAGGTQTWTINPHTFATSSCTDASFSLASVQVEADVNDSICEWDGTDNDACADNKAVLRDSDGDGVDDGDDNCPDAANAGQEDADGDGVGDACDACPGFDDAQDADGDTVPDGCDVCAGSDDGQDADGDGVPDGCDVCAGSDDGQDADGDTVPDGCDVCPGSDDGQDADNDTVPDGCDVCAGFDDTQDADGDGMPDGCDVCTGFDDTQDADGDTVPDGCDVCAGSDDGQDADNDTVPDGCDNCPITPNAGQEDGDGDGQGDVCDACPNDAADDADGDGLCGDVDNCPDDANADQTDGDGDGVGDACDAMPVPLLEVVKDLDPASDGGKFNLRIDGVTKASNVGHGGGTGPQEASVGRHTVGETAGATTSLSDYDTSIQCRDGGGEGQVVAQGADALLDVTLAADEQIRCTVRNRLKRGTIIVQKQTDPDGAAGSFTFSGHAAGAISDGGTIVVSNLLPGAYTTAEADPGPDFELTAITCNDGNSTGNLDTRTATFVVEAGETVKCTFSNARRSLQVSKATLWPVNGLAGLG